MPITLRRYRSSDLAAMTALDAQCFESDFLFGEALMKVLAETADALTLIAETPTGELAGFAIAHCRQHEAPETSYLVTIDVSPALRRAGVGGHLLAATEHFMQESCSQHMELHVHTGNIGAIRFYQRHGYTHCARVPGFYGPVDRDAYLYRKDLAASLSPKIPPVRD